MTLRNAPALSILSDTISMIEKDKMPIIRVDHPKFQAGISLHGGHVLWFQPQGQDDIIWLSKETAFATDKAIRGGVPICWPWFGRIAAPAHGFVRTSEWQLLKHQETDEKVTIHLALESTPETLVIWPYAFQAKFIIEMDSSLKMTLEVSNTDQQPWRFSGALHTYLNVGDINKVEITGAGPCYLDSLQAHQKIENHQTPLMLNDTIDRVYTQPEELILVVDPTLNRTLSIKNQGHNSAVLWNPWQQGAQSMADMSDDGYLSMLCVESTIYANSLADGKLLAPGEKYQLSSEISIL